MYIVKSLVIYYSMKTANEDRSSSAGQGWILAGGRKGLIFWRERSLPPAFFIVLKKMPSYRKSEQHTDRYFPTVCMLFFLLYRLFRRSLVSAAVSLPCTDVKGERFSG